MIFFCIILNIIKIFESKNAFLRTYFHPIWNKIRKSNKRNPGYFLSVLYKLVSTRSTRGAIYEMALVQIKSQASVPGAKTTL